MTNSIISQSSKTNIPITLSSSSTGSSLSTTTITSSIAELKKPIIAKLKAGVKLQVTERMAENQGKHCFFLPK